MPKPKHINIETRMSAYASYFADRTIRQGGSGVSDPPTNAGLTGCVSCVSCLSCVFEKILQLFILFLKLKQHKGIGGVTMCVSWLSCLSCVYSDEKISTI